MEKIKVFQGKKCIFSDSICHLKSFCRGRIFLLQFFMNFPINSIHTSLNLCLLNMFSLILHISIAKVYMQWVSWLCFYLRLLLLLSTMIQSCTIHPSWPSSVGLAWQVPHQKVGRVTSLFRVPMLVGNLGNRSECDLGHCRPGIGWELFLIGAKR